MELPPFYGSESDFMSESERLHELIDVLPPHQVHALLTLLEPGSAVSNEDFAKRLADAPEEDVDEETTVRLRAAFAEPRDYVSNDELKRQLGL